MVPSARAVLPKHVVESVSGSVGLGGWLVAETWRRPLVLTAPGTTQPAAIGSRTKKALTVAVLLPHFVPTAVMLSARCQLLSLTADVASATAAAALTHHYNHSGYSSQTAAIQSFVRCPVRPTTTTTMRQGLYARSAFFCWHSALWLPMLLLLFARHSYQLYYLRCRFRRVKTVRKKAFAADAVAPIRESRGEGKRKQAFSLRNSVSVTQLCLEGCLSAR